VSKYGIARREPMHQVGDEARRHRCHALGCTAPCPPKHLMCPGHWALVPTDLQAEVYRTASLRGKARDKTWAAWWRASHRAMAAVRLLERPDLGEQVQKWLDHQLDMAAFLEGK
jgi:hypothetical protein